VRLSDLRFYVSDLVVTDADGVEHALLLAPDGRWQQDGVALIDLENAAAACMNGDSEMRSIIAGTTTAKSISAVRFVVGVPFSQNHANPLLADAPLNDSAMHWHWRSGYKFLRAGVTTGDDSFWLHLGSTGCAGTVQNITSCASPNRVTVELTSFSPGVDHIAIDLAALFANVDLQDGTPGDCSSGPSEENCTMPFSALGLSFAGHAASEQTVFRVLQ
jgi:uncharacterized repeat protein (TIGR04052 family)